ncbi:hypothetical protein [Rhizobium leguminosarum]|uniref:hypothetical protein n=1 Tax=Rhizobium leguminosarum TaxID=384 RepID=UPI001C9210D1|nr:hypothetical protein [Rhizobium leguminosarum]MBY3027070.1 hypothetical protein [Rhizobium leguminosarum]
MDALWLTELPLSPEKPNTMVSWTTEIFGRTFLMASADALTNTPPMVMKHRPVRLLLFRDGGPQ